MRKEARRFDLSSKFWRTLLLVLAAFLVFVGPTYVVYVLNIILEINFAVSMVSGFALFIVGLALIWYLLKKGVIS
ncbi:MAG: hypothetical protein QME50_07375 [Candidatus Bathyarchaeota archaeon]|nr:hypothetical protein [Candidatus Bathyarchaeota archaeon]